MTCGESAGIAAAQAIEEAAAVQSIDMAAYKVALQAAGQKLCWDPEHDRAPASGQGGLTFARLLRDCDTSDDALVSQVEWSAGKPGWEWLFEFIDTDSSGTIDKAEYDAFQQYKVKNPGWKTALRKKTDAC